MYFTSMGASSGGERAAQRGHDSIAVDGNDLVATGAVGRVERVAGVSAAATPGGELLVTDRAELRSQGKGPLVATDLHVGRTLLAIGAHRGGDLGRHTSASGERRSRALGNQVGCGLRCRP